MNCLPLTDSQQRRLTLRQEPRASVQIDCSTMQQATPTAVVKPSPVDQPRCHSVQKQKQSPTSSVAARAWKLGSPKAKSAPKQKRLPPASPAAHRKPSGHTASIKPLFAGQYEPSGVESATGMPSSVVSAPILQIDADDWLDEMEVDAFLAQEDPSDVEKMHDVDESKGSAHGRAVNEKQTEDLTERRGRSMRKSDLEPRLPPSPGQYTSPAFRPHCLTNGLSLSVLCSSVPATPTGGLGHPKVPSKGYPIS
jgi:hypothetical protein